MALKEIFHVIASEFPVDADDFATIPSGKIVNLDVGGNIELPNAAADMPLGVAGDTRATAFSATTRNPEGSALVTGAHLTQTSGQTRWTQNRVADNYDETLASSLMTVYHGGGEFWTDQYATLTNTGGTPNWVIGREIYSTWNGNGSETVGGLWTPCVGGKTYYTGTLVGDPQALPSGVPGTDVQGSISFGTFVHVLLNIGNI